MSDELDTHLRFLLLASEAEDLQHFYDAGRSRLRLVIDAAVRAEREACAKLCDDWKTAAGAGYVLMCVAAAIRNRSNTP